MLTRRPALIAAFTVLVAWGGSALFGADVPVMLVVTNIALFIAVVLDVVTTPTPASLSVRRIVPEVATQAREAPLAWRLDNPIGHAVRVTVADELPPSLRAVRSGGMATVPASGSAELRTTMEPARRGRIRVGHLNVGVHGRLGLVIRRRRLGLRSDIRVHPPFRFRDEAELRLRQAREHRIGLRSVRSPGSGSEFESLRDYDVGDDTRRIDWAATARRGRPIVRTYRTERSQNVVVLVDNGRVMAGRVAGVPRVEHAVDAALMLGAVSTGLGDRCGLVAFDSTVRAVIPARADRAQPTRFTEALFDLEPHLAESDYAGAFSATLARFRRRSLFVILTDLLEQAVVDALLPALPLVTRSHLVVVGAIRDPEVAEWAEATTDDVEETYRRTAAMDVLAERRRAAGMLRSRGARVVDASVGTLPGQLVEEYLGIKAGGAL